MTRASPFPVGAHYGLRDWLSQRITAIVMLVYTVLFLGILLWHGGLDYPTWKALFASRKRVVDLASPGS